VSAFRDGLLGTTTATKA